MKKLIVILCLVMPTLNLRAQDYPVVNVLVPKFQSLTGKSEIGWKTALILGLQIWRTYSSPTRAKSQFDNANIIFNTQSPPTTPEEVEKLARRQRNKPNLVLWGRTSLYGDGVVVEPSLLVRPGAGKNGLGSNIWSITVPTGKESRTISVDIPEWQYEFAPIVLDSNMVLNFTKNSMLDRGLQISYLHIYELKSTNTKIIGLVGATPVQALKHEGDWSLVTVQDINRPGWIYLPHLSTRPSELVNFCSGVIRILRKDWPGAVDLFQEVLEKNGAPTSIKVNSYLYMAIAYDKMNDEAKSYSMIAEAYKLNPYAKTTTKYLLMSYLARLTRALSRGPQGPERKEIIHSIQELLSKNKVLFAEDDGWIMQVRQVLADITG